MSLNGAIAEAVVLIRADGTSFGPDVVRQGTAAGDRAGSVFGERFKRRAKVAIAAGGAAIFAGVTAGLRTGFNELTDYEKGLSNLRAGLKSTKDVSHTTAGGLEHLAKRIQSYSGQTDDSIVASEQLLLTFPKIRNEAGKMNKIFDRTVKVSADMAQRLGGDASSQAIRLGRALQDPVKGMTALTRAGVSFTDQQKAQTKALVEGGVLNALAAEGFTTTVTQFNAVLKQNNNDVNASIRQITGPLSAAQQKMFDHYAEGGHTIEAQRLELRELNKEFGGSARLYGQTLPGQLDRTKRAYEDIAQEVATEVLPYALRFTKWIRKDALPALEDFGGWVKSHKTQLEWLAGIFAGLAISVKALKGVNAVRGLLGTVTRGRVGGGVLGSVAARGGSPANPLYVMPVNGGLGGPGGRTKPGGGGFFGRIFGGSGEGIIPKIGGGLVLGFDAARAGLATAKGKTAGGILGAVGGGIGGIGKGFSEDFKGSLGGDIGDFFQNAGGILSTIGRLNKGDHELAGAQKDAADAAKQHAQRLADLNTLLVKNPGLTEAAAKAHGRLALSMRSVVGEAKIEAALLGHDLGRGLIAGIEAEIPHATVAGKLLVSRLVDNMRKAADAHSPSRVTQRLGQDLADGLIKGLQDREKALQTQVDKMSSDVMNLRGRAQALASGIRGGILNDSSILNTPNQTAQGIKSYFRHVLDVDRRFTHQAESLRGRLPKGLVNTLELAGPLTAGNLVKQLAHADREDRSDIGRLFQQIRHTAVGAGRQARQEVYDPQIAGLVHELKGLRDDLHGVAREIRGAQNTATHRTQH